MREKRPNSDPAPPAPGTSPSARCLSTAAAEGVLTGTTRSPCSASIQSVPFRTMMPTMRTTSSPTPGGKDSTMLPSAAKADREAMPSPVGSRVPKGSTAPSGGRDHASASAFSPPPSRTHPQWSSSTSPVPGCRMPAVRRVTVRVPSTYSAATMATEPSVTPLYTMAADSLKRTLPATGRATAAETAHGAPRRAATAMRAAGVGA
mmetsp:Transcript_34742/g.87128  ORF Transcript_34742/g.87128 Transcript_34742/m.87128 type:complete len:205 (-) Transcript_34742:250-864(-)